MEKLLILILTAAIFTSGCVSDEPAVKSVSSDALQGIEDVRSELQAASASGGITPESYEEISGKIESFDALGYSTEAQELRQMLSQISVGGQQGAQQISQESESMPQQANGIPRLKNLGVRFDTWNPATNKAGDFLFVQGTFEEKILVPFGHLVVNDNGAKRLPEMTYILPVGTPIVSPIDGIVFDIQVIDWSQDYAVQLKTSKDEDWMVGFEHLVNLRVSEGEIISADQVIGEAAPWNSASGFAELVVWKGGATESDIVKHCPFDALEDELKPVYAEKINSLVADWEKFKGKNIYDEEKWALPGCILVEMTEAEAMSPAVGQPLQSSQSSQSTQPSAGTGVVRWDYVNNTVYVPSSAPPACPEPLAFQTPADVNKATSILYPGQYRGSDYKPHGGFRFDGHGNSIEVRAPLDGHVVDGVRYMESGVVQYMFDIVNECGIMYRFDHLFELSPEFQSLADKLPSAIEGDSRTTNIEPFFIKKGDLIATKLGSTGNVFFDWGVYDLRKENEASQGNSYRTEHQDERHQAFHAICWLDYLQEPDRTVAKNLPGSGVEGKTSDYC